MGWVQWLTRWGWPRGMGPQAAPAALPCPWGGRGPLESALGGRGKGLGGSLGGGEILWGPHLVGWVLLQVRCLQGACSFL